MIIMKIDKLEFKDIDFSKYEPDYSNLTNEIRNFIICELIKRSDLDKKHKDYLLKHLDSLIEKASMYDGLCD